MSNQGTTHLHQTIVSSGKAFWLVVGITSAMNFLMLTVPIYSLQIYDRVLTARSISTLAYLTLIACLLIAAYSFLEFVRLKVLLRLGNRFELTHATRLIHTCITQSAKSNAPSSSLLRDLAVIRSFIASPHGVSALLDIPIAIFFLIVVFLISPVLGAAMLTGAVGLVVIAYLTDRTTLEPIKLANEASQKAQNRAAEIVDRSEIVEALGMRNNLIAHWQEAARESLSYQSQSSDLVATNTAISRWSRLIISIAMTALGAYLAIQDKITMGAMIASSILMGRGLAPLESVIPLWRQVANVRLAWQRVSDTLTISDRAEQTLQLPKPLGRLTLEKVTYASPGSEQPIIKGLTFDLPAGAMLGVVGPVAAGKSTLAKLLCGVWKPQMGTVRMDGADVFQWPRDDFGKHVGYLPQGCELFVGSIRDNISRFSNGSAEAVIEAAQLAGVHELILRLPRGYDTIIGTHGVVLSGGTRQRIALARAIFGNPSLVVLDEPSASLDEEGEQALLAALRTLKEKRTTIVVISHQRNILRDADRIAVIVDGQLFKYGTRQELLPSESDQRHSIYQ